MNKLAICTVLLFLLIFASFCHADIMEKLSQKAAQHISQSYELGEINALKLDISNQKLYKAMEIALTKISSPYKISDKASITIWANYDEEREYFWERPYRYNILTISAYKNGNTIWSDLIRSQKELITRIWDLPLRIALAIILWFVIVTCCYSASDCSSTKKIYFILIWAVIVVLIIWFYVGPTFIY